MRRRLGHGTSMLGWIARASLRIWRNWLSRTARRRVIGLGRAFKSKRPTRGFARSAGVHLRRLASFRSCPFQSGRQGQGLAYCWWAGAVSTGYRRPCWMNRLGDLGQRGWTSLAGGPWRWGGPQLFARRAGLGSRRHMAYRRLGSGRRAARAGWRRLGWR